MAVERGIHGKQIGEGFTTLVKDSDEEARSIQRCFAPILNKSNVALCLLDY